MVTPTFKNEFSIECILVFLWPWPMEELFHIYSLVFEVKDDMMQNYFVDSNAGPHDAI